MTKKNKQQHKSGGSAEQSPEGATKKKVQVGQTPGGSNTASPVVAKDKKKANGGSPKKPQQDTDAHVDMKEASEKVDSVLKRRKSIDEVHEAGILKTQEDLEKMAQISEAMEEKIEARPNQEEMHSQNEHILNPTGANHRLSGSLASTAKELEKSMTSDKIDRLLVSRPDVDELEKMHMLNTNVAPQLQSVQKQLQRKMSADELSHRLDSRPDVQDLRDQGIVHDDGVAPSLQATQEKLQRQINSDRVSHQLVKRPSITELTSQGVLEKNDTQMAPSLTAAAKKLERNLVQNQVSHLLETRPDKDELVTHHILGDNEEDVAPSLQGPKHQLERQLKADQVARQLRKRPSIGELEEKGIIEEGEIGDENADVNKKFALSRRARYTLALKAASRIAADNLITQDEKSRLKDRILSDDEKVVAAIECYELDHDVEEMLDTLYRVAKMV